LFLLAGLRIASALQETPLVHYSGEIRAGRERSWLELELGANTARVDLVSQWSLGLTLVPQRAGEELRLELPEFGTLRLRAHEEGWSGELEVPGGGRGTVRLEPTPTAPVRFEEVSFPSGELELVATLGVPAGRGPHPAVILVPGGGDSFREQSSTRFLAEFLPRAGIACLVYDKRGSGGSQGNWRTVGLAALADDALAAVESLRERDDIDPGAIGFFAASQGTWVALQACARAGGHVAFLVNHSGPALPLLDADTFAMRSAAAQAGLTAAEQEEVLALWRLECEALRTGVPPAEHRPLLDAIGRAAARPWFARLPYQATPSDSWWVRWYPLVMDFDPRPLLEELELPMLWLYGTHDSQSDALASVAVVGRLAHERNRPWSVHIFPGANHGISVPFLVRADGSGPMTMADGYFEILLAWLARVRR
jgi:pimeloyl-ACP methyl ester carboxylesterase